MVTQGKAAAAMSPKDEPSPQPQSQPQLQPQVQPKQIPQQPQPQASGEQPGNLDAYCARRGLTVGAALRAFLRNRLNSQR